MTQYAPRHIGHLLSWVRESVALATEISGGNHSRERDALFYVRLFGLVVDLGEAYRSPSSELARRTDKLVDPFLGELRDEFRLALDDTRKALSERELLYVETRRVRECHPIVDSLRAKYADGDDWNKRAMAVLNKKKVSIDVLLQWGIGMERTAGGADKLAQQLARKVVKPLSALGCHTHAWAAYYASRMNS